MAGLLAKVTASVPVGASQPVPHTLVAAPHIVLLAAGTDPNIAKAAGSPTQQNSLFTNGGGSPAPVVTLQAVIHSVGGDGVKQMTGTLGSTGVNQIAHGLSGAPDLIFVGVGTHANILGNAITADATRLALQGTAGQAYDVLLVKLHSLWGIGQWGTILRGTMPGAQSAVQVPGSATNYAIPHGLIRAPGIVLLGARTGGNIVVGAQAPDATNVYVTNNGGTPQNVEALVIAGHSLNT